MENTCMQPTLTSGENKHLYLVFNNYEKILLEFSADYVRSSLFGKLWRKWRGR